MKNLNFLLVSVLLACMGPLPHSEAQTTCIRTGKRFLPGIIKKGKATTYLARKDTRNHEKFKKFCSTRSSPKRLNTSAFFDGVANGSSSADICSQLHTVGRGFYVLGNGRDITLGAHKLQRAVVSADFCLNNSSQENSGNSSDGLGRYAGLLSFSASSNACGSVSDTIEKSFTVGRRRSNTGVSDTATLELFGNWKSATHGVVNCSITFSAADSLQTAWCTKNKKPVPLALVSGCSGNTATASFTYPGFFKGHWGFVREDALHAGCVMSRPSEDSEVGAAIKPDCSAVKNTGFNTSVINLTHTVDGSSRQIVETTLKKHEVRNMAGALLSQGVAPVLVPDFVVKVNGEVKDGYEFFETLATDTAFQSTLNALVLDYASLAQSAGIPYFAPVMEIDKMFAGYSRGSQWSQEILPQLRARYSGRLLWIAGTPEMDVNLNARGYDILGFNTSPLDDQTAEAYGAVVTEGANRLRQVCASLGIARCFITASGIWGTTLKTPYWAQNYGEVYRTATTVTDSNAFPGLMIFDGKNDGSGELALAVYSDVRERLASFFAGK